MRRRARIALVALALLAAPLAAEAQGAWAVLTLRSRQSLIAQNTPTDGLEQLRQRTAQARRLAENADAAKLASQLWARAVLVQQAAQEAAERRDLDRARALLREAEQAYQAAAKEAHNVQAQLRGQTREISAPPGEPRPGEADVARSDGSRQCDVLPNEASLLEGERTLIAAGLVVLAKWKGSDGAAYPAMCGQPTGRMDVYRIRAINLPRALAIGFQRYPPRP